MPTRICLNCSSFSIRRSHRRGFYELCVLPLFFQRPYRCMFCYARFYASVLRKRKLQTSFVREKAAAVSLLAPADAGIFKMTVVALLVPALLAAAGPARIYLHDAVPERWKYMLNSSDQPPHAANHETPARAGAATLATTGCCSAVAPVPLALVSLARRENVLAAQQEGPRVAVGRMQSTGAVFVNEVSAPADTTLFERDQVRTGGDGVARVDVLGRGAISIAANSKVSFVASWRYFASLLAGRISFSAFPAAARFQLNIGQFVLTPSADTSSAADIDMAADGSAVVQATQGSIGIIALEGPTSLFLQPGEAARITASGQVFPISTQEAQGGQPAAPENPPGTQPQPQGTPQPVSRPSGNRTAVIVGVAAAGAVGAALALGKGKSSSSPPVSPSTP